MSRASEFGDLSASALSPFFSSRSQPFPLLFLRPRPVLLAFLHDLAPFLLAFPLHLGLFSLLFLKITFLVLSHDLSLFSLLFSRHRLFSLLFLMTSPSLPFHTTSAFSSNFCSRPSVLDQGNLVQIRIRMSY